jgi:hypothetical protein
MTGAATHPLSARSLAPTWRRYCAPTASTPDARRCPHQRRRAVDRSPPGDLDYRLLVVRDCCADPDAEAHAMLLDIVIAKLAAVVTTAELAGALTGGSS